MLSRNSRLAAVLASAATLSMVATPAFAQSWGGWGGDWGSDWGRRRNHVDVGEVLAGIAILGAIAAIANTANQNNRDRRGDDRRFPRQRSNGYGNDNDQQWQQNGSLDHAVSRCTEEVSRGSARSATADVINRDGDGWRVQGRTEAGRPFTCSVDSNGRIRNVQVDGHAY